MRLIGALIILFGLGTGTFAVVLGRFLQSGHSGSALHNAGNRIASSVRDDPEVYARIQWLLSEISHLFSWLNGAFVVLAGLSLFLLAAGVFILRSKPTPAHPHARI